MGERTGGRRRVGERLLLGAVLAVAGCGGATRAGTTSAGSPASPASPATSTTVTTAPTPPPTSVATPASPTVEARPDDQPLTISVEVTTPAVAGSPVTVHVVGIDPDAPVTTNCGTWYFDDPLSLEPQIGDACSIVRHEGPPSATPRPGRLEVDYAHTFSQPGDYRFTVQLLSGEEGAPGDRSADVYADTATAELIIHVS